MAQLGSDGGSRLQCDALFLLHHCVSARLSLPFSEWLFFFVAERRPQQVLADCESPEDGEKRRGAGACEDADVWDGWEIGTSAGVAVLAD